jgi:hypothetical protein
MPFLNAPEMTWQAVEDGLNQSLPGVRVLLVDQGASRADREDLDARIDAREDHRVLCWHYLPMLPSLSAVWNRALKFVWELGGTEALVVNNDVRLHKETYNLLLRTLQEQAVLFVSAVGVREGQFNADELMVGVPEGHGGPDFSCFLTSREGHDKYPFDELFRPAYHEDLDLHRRYMLGGDGDKIFSVNLPFLHYASGTIKAYTPEERAAFNAKFAACKAYYTQKWGGGPNAETFFAPFDAGVVGTTTAGLPTPPTTPDLQRYWQVQRRPTDGQAAR